MTKRRKIEIAFVGLVAITVLIIFAWSQFTGKAVFSDKQKAPEAIRWQR